MMPTTPFSCVARGRSRLTGRLAGWPRGARLLVLVLTVLAVAGCLTLALGNEELRQGEPLGCFRDYRFHAAVTERVRGGEDYYQAVPAVFREFDYRTWSIFNFRPPMHTWLLAGLPPPLGRLLLMALGLGTWAAGCALLWREGGRLWLGRWFAAAGAVALGGTLVWCFAGPVYLFAELWAGLLITLSVCAYGFGRWRWAVLAGLAALFLRELSLPYCGLALAVALLLWRRAEVLAWLGGLAAYGAFYAWHYHHAVALVAVPAGLLGTRRWLQFGGPTFLLQTCQAVNAFLVFLLPWWSVAIYLPLALLGLAGWRGETGLRAGLTVAVYLAAFCSVGSADNAYWGLLYAPTLALGVAWTPVALSDLCRGPTGR